MRREDRGKQARVAGFVRGRIAPAGDQIARVGERRLQRDALGDRFRGDIQAARAQRRNVRARALEVASIGEDLKNAARLLVVFEPELVPQRLELAPTVERKREDRGGIRARAPGQTFVQEPQAPGPLRPIRARPEQQRRVLSPQPLENQRRRLGIRPRLGVTRRDLATVGEARLERRSALPIDDGDLMAGARDTTRSRFRPRLLRVRLPSSCRSPPPPHDARKVTGTMTRVQAEAFC